VPQGGKSTVWTAILRAFTAAIIPALIDIEGCPRQRPCGGDHSGAKSGQQQPRESASRGCSVPTLATGFMLQRYCGYLNHINRCGDVMAESRGGREDRLLRDSYERTYERGAWQRQAGFFQKALTTRQLKLKGKRANIAGLQLADILGHPVKQEVLRRYDYLHDPSRPFARRLIEVIDCKFNKHLYTGRVEGYGHVLYPK
jgi:hypothetical protein